MKQRAGVCASLAAIAAFAAFTAEPVTAQGRPSPLPPVARQIAAECAGLPTHAELTEAMKHAAGPGSGLTGTNRGFGLNMWGTVASRDGVVCAVVFTGGDRHAQWPGSRVISAQEANTANAFSLDGLALSTANLYRFVQPGESLFGLQESNPVDPSVAYQGPSSAYGKPNDPMGRPEDRRRERVRRRARALPRRQGDNISHGANAHPQCLGGETAP